EPGRTPRTGRDARRARGEPSGPGPGRAVPCRPVPDRPGAAPGAAAGSAGLGGLLRLPGRLDRAARRHFAAPVRCASLACRVGELRRVPARRVRGDSVGDLAAAAGADAAADAYRPHAPPLRLVPRRPPPGP